MHPMIEIVQATLVTGSLTGCTFVDAHMRNDAISHTGQSLLNACRCNCTGGTRAR